MGKNQMRVKRGQFHHRAKFTDHEIELMRQMHDAGINCAEIARRMETARSWVWKVVHYRYRTASA